MKKLAVMLLVPVILSCGNGVFLKNQTTPGGYAMGEKIEFRFATDRIKNPPDSIMVYVVEKKTDFRYSLWAGKINCDKVCEYGSVWDGRKPDGTWPAGGLYQIFATLDDNGVYSDTVQIGLAD